MSRFFRRATLEPIKFSFEVHLLALERMPPSLPDSTVVIRWHRGSKRGGESKDVRITKAGGAVCEKFELKATMFRNDKSLKYDSKVLSFSVAIVGEQSSSSKPDTCSLDLASLQLDECSGACLRLALSGGVLDGASLSLKILPRLRVAGVASISAGKGTGTGDASDASDASVMSQRDAEAGSDANDGVDARDTSQCEPSEAYVDEETLAQQQETLALGQLKLAAARRKAAAVKYAAGDSASGDDHESRAVHHDMLANHHRQLAAVHRAQSLRQRSACDAEPEEEAGTGVPAQVGRTRRASGGGAAAAAKEADPHNKFRGRFVTDKNGAIVRAEEMDTEQDERAVAADFAIGAAAAAVASGVGLACNGMASDAPADVDGNENSAPATSWWCGVCF